MATVLQEQMIPFGKAAGAFPGRQRVGMSTLHRWRLNGVRGVRLETWLIGGQRFTSAEAIQRFLERQNAGETADSEISAEQRQARSTAARAALAARGI